MTPHIIVDLASFLTAAAIRAASTDDAVLGRYRADCAEKHPIPKGEVGKTKYDFILFDNPPTTC